jgi:hypothetical protein
MSSKRPRDRARSSTSTSASSTTTTSDTRFNGHTAKAARSDPYTNASASLDTDALPLLCTLPPTCNPPHGRPTPLANSAELETHYAKFHAHVCEWERCGCVFPEGRLLELVSPETKFRWCNVGLRDGYAFYLFLGEVGLASDGMS